MNTQLDLPLIIISNPTIISYHSMVQYTTNISHLYQHFIIQYYYLFLNYIDLPIGIALKLLKSLCCPNYNKFSFLYIQFWDLFLIFCAFIWWIRVLVIQSQISEFPCVIICHHLYTISSFSCFIFVFYVILQMATFHAEGKFDFTILVAK
jgi:hypothetical protein